MVIKHNKIKNSGLLFELLVRQITSDTLSNKNSKALDILKKYYNNTEISKEFKIYNNLASSKNLSESKANMLLSTSIEEFRKLDKNKLKADKYKLISEINKSYGTDDFFKSKVDNYKLLASIYMLFENDSNSNDINETISYKMAILEHISKKDEAKVTDPLDDFKSMDVGSRHLVYKLMLEKFNNEYSDLLPKQKSLLKEYINNISTNETLRGYVNEEYISVKKELTKKVKTVTDEARKVKLQEVVSFIKPVENNKQVTDKDMNNLMYYYELLNEFELEN